MGKSSLKNRMESIQNQIQKLKAEKLKIEKNLEKSKHAKIISLIKNQNGFSYDFNVLIGALFNSLKSLNDLNQNDEKLATYHKIGEEFLKTQKTKNKDKKPSSKKEEHKKDAA